MIVAMGGDSQKSITLRLGCVGLAALFIAVYELECGTKCGGLIFHAT